MTEERQSFLGRWSRLKQARRADDSSMMPGAEPEAAPQEARAVPTGTEGAAEDAAADQSGNPPDLPPIESLGKDSDFTAFMKEGVPEETKRLALRALWRSDPVLANLDGLLEYGEDFSAPWRMTGAVATVYRVGKGMPDLLERLVEEVKEGEVTASDGEAASKDTLCDREEDSTPCDASEPSDVAETPSRQGSGKTPSNA